MNSTQRGNIRKRESWHPGTGRATLRSGQENSQDEGRGKAPHDSCARVCREAGQRAAGDPRALPAGTVKKTKENKTLGGFVCLTVPKSVHLESLGVN